MTETILNWVNICVKKESENHEKSTILSCIYQLYKEVESIPFFFNLDFEKIIFFPI